MPEALWTVLCGVFLCAGVLCMLCGVAGVYRFRYLLGNGLRYAPRPKQ
jgi:hypothetical protein